MLIFFPHVPKAGGTSLRDAFYKTLGETTCVKVWNPAFGADVSAGAFSALPPEAFTDKRAVIGHLKFSEFLDNPHCRDLFDSGRVSSVTCARHPVDRLISLYNYIRYNKDHPQHESVKSQVATDYLMRQTGNTHHAYFRMQRKDTPQEIVNRMMVYRLENSLDGFSDYFCGLGYSKPRLRIRNKTQSLARGRRMLRRADLPADIVDALLQKHDHDTEIYRLAL